MRKGSAINVKSNTRILRMFRIRLLPTHYLGGFAAQITKLLLVSYLNIAGLRSAIKYMIKNEILQ
jgi:hypothetical protein